MSVHNKKKAVLRQWQFSKRSGKWCVFGEVVNHPKHIEGEDIITSPLLFVCFKTMTAETEDTVYELL
jgi:hypothetical protein